MNSSKGQHLFEMESVCNIANVFTVTFDQFKAFLLNKSIIFFGTVVYCTVIQNVPKKSIPKTLGQKVHLALFNK